jgi:hypothetical protein
VGFGGFDVAKAGPVGANRALARNGDDIARTMNAFLNEAYRRKGQLDTGTARALPRDPRWQTADFGPLNPLVAEPLDETGERPDGQPLPRLYEYPTAYNMTLGKERYVQWDNLRRSSEMPIFRACIELRKSELSSMEWGIRVNPKVASRLALDSDKNGDQVASELRKKHRDEIDRIESWWQMPDRKNGRNFGEWIGLAVDEQLTHDALAIYPHQTYGGDLCGLWILDGTSIMPLLDQTGGRPQSPLAAYQQILYGFPRGEFTAQTYIDPATGNLMTPGGLTQGQLIYKRRTPRVRTPYGYSATEQALLDGLLYNKRFGWMVSEYTEGTVGTHYFESDGLLDWSPEQLLDYERQFNMRMSGMTAERMLANFLPPGLKPVQLQNFGEKYTANYDLHLIKLVAMHFNTTATELGFPETGGLGSQGFHEGQEDINFRRGRIPDLKWFADLCTEISLTYLRMHPDLEFYFLGLDSEDEAATDLLEQNRVASGRQTINEARARLGLNGFSFKEADMPMLQTARGVVFLDGASDMAPAGVLIEPASEINQISGPDEGAKAKPTSPTQRRPLSSASAGGRASKDELEHAVARADAEKEFKRYSKWLLSGAHKRAFKAEFITKELAEELGYEEDDFDPDLFEFAKASGAGPKADSPGPARNWSLYTDLS